MVSMKKRGVELVLGDYVDLADTTEVEGVTTRSGKSLRSADFVVRLISSHVSTVKG